MRLRQLRALWPILGLLYAVPSPAFPWPSANRSTVPALLTMMAGRGAQGADPGYPFKVLVRNSDGMPVSMVTVQLTFSIPDLWICTDQGDPGVSVDCSRQSISALCNQQGEVTFYVLGCGRNSGGSPGLNGPGLEVRADGFFLGTARVAALDQDGWNGVDGNDLGALLADIFSGQTFSRSDYDGDGSLGGNDLSLWLAAFFNGAPVLGCYTAVCPH